MEPLIQEFVDLSDKFYTRFTARIDGLTDDEYRWEPAPDCWSLSPDADGKLHMRWGLIFDEVAPVTTIAWRLTHISDLLSEQRCASYIGLDPEPENLFESGAPGDVATARVLLEKAFARWKRYVTATDAGRLFEKVGPIAGDHASATRMTFILHILDEVIHHGAEIGVLRDLYTAERTHDPVVSALLNGRAVETSDVEKAKSAHPDLVRTAAATARWEAIPRLLELGFEPGSDGRTALHHAAADGRVNLMRALIDAGAPTEVRDPIYKATPVVWAEFFNRTEAAEFLRSLVPQ